MNATRRRRSPPPPFEAITGGATSSEGGIARNETSTNANANIHPPLLSQQQSASQLKSHFDSPPPPFTSHPTTPLGPSASSSSIDFASLSGNGNGNGNGRPSIYPRGPSRASAPSIAREPEEYTRPDFPNRTSSTGYNTSLAPEMAYSTSTDGNALAYSGTSTPTSSILAVNAAASAVGASALHPRLAVILGVDSRWYVPLALCRGLSIVPPAWWGLRCAVTFLAELLRLGDEGGVVKVGGMGAEWDTERRFRITEVALAILWVCFVVMREV